ncbi:MAG TPA: metallophosphoesterase family protein, partial [Desulfobacterales bacterium]|nr:metallophosphoesterase family protein [Desulfobacterales bacterium]
SVLVLCFATALVLGDLTSISPPGVDRPAYVYLTYASPDPAHTVNVSWRTDENYTGEVHYDIESRGGTPGAYDLIQKGTGGITTSRFNGYIHHVELIGLDPDTTYYFICGSPDHGWSEELNFRTAPAEGKDIRFVVGGDSRSGGENWPKARDDVSRLMASYDPDFVIFSGDFISNGETQTGGDTWDNWLGAVYECWRTEDGRLIPIIPVIGNHEIHPQPPVYDPQLHASNYYTVFSLPRNERWYSLNWGPDLHLTILDSEILDAGSDVWGEQLGWLGHDLLEHQDDLWKVTAAHRPAFSSGPHGSTPSIQEDWVPEFDRYHLDLYFSGHDHDYERTHPIENGRVSENGTVYVISGGWGAPLYWGNPSWWTAYGPASSHHFILVDLYENGTLFLRAVGSDNVIIDEFSICRDLAEAGITMKLPSKATSCWIQVSGTAPPNELVKIYVNGEVSATTVASDDGQYNAHVRLEEGTNVVRVEITGAFVENEIRYSRAGNGGVTLLPLFVGVISIVIVGIVIYELFRR